MGPLGKAEAGSDPAGPGPGRQMQLPRVPAESGVCRGLDPGEGGGLLWIGHLGVLETGAKGLGGGEQGPWFSGSVMVGALVGSRKHPCALTLPQLQVQWLDRAKPYLPTFGLHRRGW